MVTSGRSYGCMPEKRSVARRATSDQWICYAGWRAMAQGLRCDYLSSTPDLNGATLPSSFEGFGVFLRSFSTKYDWNTAHRCPIALRTTMNCDPNRVDVSSLEETYNDLLDVWSTEVPDYSLFSDCGFRPCLSYWSSASPSRDRLFMVFWIFLASFGLESKSVRSSI